MQLSLNSSSAGGSAPSSAFYGSSLKKLNSRFTQQKTSDSKTFRIIAAETGAGKEQKKADRWAGLGTDISDDQQDITRGKGLVDSLFQAPSGAGTHDAIMSSYEYLSTAQKT